MRIFTDTILLTITWLLLIGEFSLITLGEGLFLGILISLMTGGTKTRFRFIRKLPKILLFILFFFKELIIANLKIAYDIITPTHYMKPAIIAYPLEAKTDIEITLIANCITLTPGTLSLDVSEDKSLLYIHCMYVDSKEEVIQSIKQGFEKRILEILR